MIGNVAQKRTHLAALAVLVALAVALFAVIQSASADKHPHIAISIGDSDNVVASGKSYPIHLTVMNDNNDTGNAAILYLTASTGISVAAVDATLDADADSREATLIVPKAAAGEYTISAGVAEDTDGVGLIEGELVITVADVGDPIGAVETSVGKVNHNKDNATDKSTKKAADDAGTTGTDNDHLGNLVAVTVTVTNSLGKAPNPSEVDEIIIFAAGADIYKFATDEDGDVTLTDPDQNSTEFEEDDVAVGDEVPASVQVFIGSNDAGNVEVSAIGIGSGGSQTSATVTLTFTGEASDITLGAPSSPLSQNGVVKVVGVDGNNDGDFTDTDDTAPVASSGEATIEVTATDASGNVASLSPGVDVNGNNDFTDEGDTAPSLGAVTFTDADDESVETIVGTVTQKQDAKDNDVSTALIITLNATEAAPGEYTLKVALGEDEETATIVVAGDAANIELEVSESSVSVGSIVTITATVTDADGNLVPDAGVVTFTAVGALDMVGLDDADTVMGGQQAALDDGVTSVRYVVTEGSGTATIIATTGKIDAVTAVSTDAAAAGAAEAVSLDCLSATNGFATYTCDMDSSASELFGLVSGRGATAVHLWNGSDWVRYSVVDGAMVPGSSDFTVTEDDILYISN